MIQRLARPFAPGPCTGPVHTLYRACAGAFAYIPYAQAQTLDMLYPGSGPVHSPTYPVYRPVYSVYTGLYTGFAYTVYTGLQPRLCTCIA